MSKRISKADNIKYALSGNDRYIASVDPGETFVVECAINTNDGTIRHLGQQLTNTAAVEQTQRRLVSNAVPAGTVGAVREEPDANRPQPATVAMH